MKYLSVTQTAEKWGISTRRIQRLCSENHIPGAVKIELIDNINTSVKRDLQSGDLAASKSKPFKEAQRWIKTITV